MRASEVSIAFGQAGRAASKVGTFSEALLAEAGKPCRTLIRMTNEWKVVVGYDPSARRPRVR